MPPRSEGRRRAGNSYEARLAGLILADEGGAGSAATALLEHRDPASLDAALRLVARHGTLTVAAFDRLADAWDRHRHVRHLGWD